MNKTWIEICLSGSGGQGLILAGIILAEAAGKYDGFEVVQTQSYGPEARGGASRSEVIISQEKIDYPKIICSDILLALTQKACDKYVQSLNQSGTLFIDSTNITKIPQFTGNIYSYPITEKALKVIGNQMVANIIALGMIVNLTKIVSIQAIENAIRNRIPERVLDVNVKAFKLGFEIGESLGLSQKVRRSKEK